MSYSSDIRACSLVCHNVATQMPCHTHIAHLSPHFSLDDMRLVGGTVQVYREDGWLSVCGDSDWDGTDAQVVCARLGYNQARVVTQSTSRVYSRWMRRVRCVGNESSLLDCPHQIISYSFCTPANVKCLNCEYTHIHTLQQ